MCPRNYHQKAEKYFHLVIKIAQYDMHYISSSLCMHAKSLQSCPSLCNLADCSPPGSSVHGIIQVRTLEWVAMPPTRGSSQPRDQTFIFCVSCTGRWVLYHQHHLGRPSPSSKTTPSCPNPTSHSWPCCAQSCPTLCNDMACGLPDSSVHGISQARLLEWVAMSFSKGSS